MIVRMKHLDLVCVASESDAALERLRSLGAVHLDLASAQGAEVAAAKGEAADAERAVRLIAKAREAKEYADSLTRIPASVEDVLKLASRIEELKTSADSIGREIKKFAPYGDFDPELAKTLLEKLGDDLKAVAELPDPLPSRRLAKMRSELESVESEIVSATAKLAACDEESIVSRFPELADRIAFSAAKELVSSQGAVSFVSGWVPVTKVEDLRAAASSNGWGTLLRDPAPGETPPTLIEPPRLFRPVKALFDGLGVAPAYTESDVSVPFMCYFSLFFAMLVGDGGYGAIMFALTLFGWFKAGAKAAARPWLILMTVFSLATIGWGLLSNTWFGAALPCCASWPTVQWLADPSYHTMMFLCFTIGASHLILARLWNAACMLNSTTCLAQVGWAGVLLCMYWVTCGIVGIFQGPLDEAALAALPEASRTIAWVPTTPGWFFPVFGVSVALVFLFSVPFRELKTRGAELGMLPLNIMSALGDIISYVRLFAVGLASVKVAQNFNDMAVGLDMPLWAKIVPMLFILLVGHGLNFAMAGLSILVHAVRLNTLEFSNHKGVSWSGYAFSPFRRR